ncbi:DNA-binding response regulator [Nitrosomonas sp. HPC101]|uniref:response regulator n=1 Tax=Nitrosomonas sp. HPC101 TaxID=1658667 RepID=UPI0013700661|nr:response regulator transcription factor [Nitrosomonas sp. HPC101]MXS84514.1 DNA-binding response regulator [Nitrosomonas sp. HPC101]
MRILVVEDDSLVASGIKQGLANAGYTTDMAESAERAIQYLQAENFDLAVVDIGLPGADGLSLVQHLRSRKIQLPVLFLTARGSMEDTVTGLDVGADDYMAKPFRLPELIARIRALIRRAYSVTSTELRHDQLVLDTASHTATLHDQPLFLTLREWTILEILLMASPRVVSKNKLLQSLTGWDRNITPNAIEVHVSRLRAKIAPGGIGIRTVRGIGYRIDQSLS